MHRLRGLKLESVKDYVQIGVGLTAIFGGLLTGVSLFASGGSSEAPPPTATIAAAVIAPTDTPTLTPVPTDTPPPTNTPAPAGEFLRVQFGTQQDPNTLLPTGATYSPDDTVPACLGDTLYAWVYHNLPPSSVIDGRISDRAGVLFAASVPVEAGASSFWISALIATPGPHTLSVELQGSELTASWAVTVACS